MSESQNDPHSFRAEGPSAGSCGQNEPVLFEFSTKQSKTLDHLALERYGIPSILLMENAAIGLRDCMLDLLQSEDDPSVWICCGPGNNGGDGFALARHLHNASVRVRVICTQPADAYRGDSAINRAILDRMGIQTAQASDLLEETLKPNPSLIVDALFGTGLSRAIEGAASDLVDWINKCRHMHGVRVVCVDVPSGLDADTGMPVGKHAVLGDLTVTMAGLKPCMARVEAHEYLGEVRVVPIGVPIELLKELGTPIEPKHRQ